METEWGKTENQNGKTKTPERIRFVASRKGSGSLGGWGIQKCGVVFGPTSQLGPGANPAQPELGVDFGEVLAEGPVSHMDRIREFLGGIRGILHQLPDDVLFS